MQLALGQLDLRRRSTTPLTADGIRRLAAVAMRGSNAHAHECGAAPFAAMIDEVTTSSGVNADNVRWHADPLALWP